MKKIVLLLLIAGRQFSAPAQNVGIGTANPSRAKMKGDKPSPQKTIGFIAQDVQKLFPELVIVVRDSSAHYKGFSDLHTLDYSGFGVLAVKAIQEQQQEIERLRQQVSELKAVVEAGRKSRTRLTAR